MPYQKSTAMRVEGSQSEKELGESQERTFMSAASALTAVQPAGEMVSICVSLLNTNGIGVETRVCCSNESTSAGKPTIASGV